MIIGINLLYLIPDKVGGTETYARDLITSLLKIINNDDKIILFCSLETAPTFNESKQLQVIALPFYAENRILRIFFEQGILPFMCIFHKIDVLLSLGYSQPIFLRCKSIVTIHDLNWYYHPEDFGAINLRVWEVLTRLSAHFATHIITDSQASRKSIIKVLGVREKKVTSILHGTPAKIDITPRESVKVLKTMGINGSYLFTVLSSAPHKNLTTLLKAFSSLRARYPDLRLVVAGLGNHPSCTDGSIIYAGYVTRKELAALYSGATVFVFPSAYEGFGYPVLEAMQYGAPVVSSDAYSLPEVVGKAGLLNSAYDQNGYRLNIEKILGHSTNRNMLVTKGVARSKELSWKSTSLETFQIITATWGTD